MGFTTEQSALLNSKLDGNKVSTRSQSGMQLSYIEGFHAIEEANRIFGFDKWSYAVKNLDKISEEKNSKGNNVIGFQAIVEVRVNAGGDYIVREDVGYGSGISRDIFGAYEGAGKEAVTDALKRALRTFGNPFGLALYDKTQKNVDYEAQERESIVEEAKEKFQAKSVQIVDYKEEIAGLMTKLGIKENDIYDCAQAVIAAGMDIKNNPKDVWLNKKPQLEEVIKIFAGF